MKKVISILMLCICFTGCTSFFKKQPQPVVVNNIAPVGGEKVWVEAETRKIWVNPHVDDNGDMIDGHYKYVVVTPGRWAVKGESNER